MGTKKLSASAIVLWDDLEGAVPKGEKTYNPATKKIWGKALLGSIDLVELAKWDSGLESLSELEERGVCKTPTPDETYEGEPDWVWVLCFPDTGYAS